MLSYAFCVSHSVVVVAVRKVAYAIAAMSEDYIHLPENPADWLPIAERFKERCIKCTIVKLSVSKIVKSQLNFTDEIDYHKMWFLLILGGILNIHSAQLTVNTFV